ncbi:Homeobox protein TGIF1 [Teratosphaeria destructans]|uniref:Homeobox protein TGIF1 n=1 Tax=Teratosphaeria destructans TaxID=418781 RepID=A0A9W7SNA6_9PEZI|nr:Homeobox protein TGIF1 [Teratosphaeria destructans]
MEALTLGESATTARNSYTYAAMSRPRSPRLPTPEASRCSNEAVDTVGKGSGYQTRAPLPGMLLRASPTRSLNDVGSYYRGSRHQSAPHSPPYGASDAPKPSLPPLKTVLADNMSSPPQTPTVLTLPYQPSPREPAYTNSTYKPPSLYPNKKPRTDSFPTAGASYSAPGSWSALGESSAPLESKASVGPASSLRARGSPEHQREPNVPQPRTNPRLDDFERRSAAQQQSSAGPWNHRERVPDRSNDRRIGEPYHPYERSHPESAYARPPPQEHPLRVQPSQRDYFTQLREDHPFDRPTPPHMSQYAHGPQYENGQSSYFMPSHYDYQHGKARKRSNLPKQSTEIMKTWFDQNIGNPYPSEEQKALFSNATGISMTQVSNWFINHRRRCPELRDKRERNRGNGRDMEM